MITDPTAIPETAEAATAHREAMDAAVAAGDLAAAQPLARALAEADVAGDEVRGKAAFVLGQSLEAEGNVDDAIAAFGESRRFGHPDAQANLDRLLATEDADSIQAAVPPTNEAEANKYYDAAKRALDHDDNERAYELFLAIYNSGVNDADQKGQAALGVATACRKQGDHDAAFQFFREASEIGNDSVREAAFAELATYAASDGNADAGLDRPSSAQLDSAEAVAEMMQAAVDRYDAHDTAGATARFTAVHGSTAAAAEQVGYAAYYLGVLAWDANDFDVARAHFREAKAKGDATTSANAATMLKDHWGE